VSAPDPTRSGRAGIAWVTGATGAWGRACARELIDRGYDVVALGRSEPAGLVDAASGLGRRCAWIRFDLAVPVATVEELVEGTPDGLRAVPDVLVDAAFSTDGDLADLARTDYVARATLIGAVVDAMRARGSGRVGVLVGQNGRLGIAGLGELSAPQGALWTWAEALGEELRRDRVRPTVTVVIPPRTPSATQRVLATRSGRDARTSPPNARPLVRSILAGKRRAGRRPTLAALAMLVR